MIFFQCPFPSRLRTEERPVYVNAMIQDEQVDAYSVDGGNVYANDGGIQLLQRVAHLEHEVAEVATLRSELNTLKEEFEELRPSTLIIALAELKKGFRHDVPFFERMRICKFYDTDLIQLRNQLIHSADVKRHLHSLKTITLSINREKYWRNLPKYQATFRVWYGVDFSIIKDAKIDDEMIKIFNIHAALVRDRTFKKHKDGVEIRKEARCMIASFVRSLAQESTSPEDNSSSQGSKNSVISKFHATFGDSEFLLV
jgi:hypothetical protein